MISQKEDVLVSKDRINGSENVTETILVESNNVIADAISKLEAERSRVQASIDQSLANLDSLNSALGRFGVSPQQDKKEKKFRVKKVAKNGAPKKASHKNGVNKTQVIFDLIQEHAPSKDNAKTSKELMGFARVSHKDDVKTLLPIDIATRLQALQKSHPPKVGIIHSPAGKRGSRYYVI